MILGILGKDMAGTIQVYVKGEQKLTAENVLVYAESGHSCSGTKSALTCKKEYVLPESHKHVINIARKVARAQSELGDRRMLGRVLPLALLTLLVLGIFTSSFQIQSVKAIGTVYIRADGSVDPSTAPISSIDNVTYTFNGDINDSIIVERDNIVVDGRDHTFQGTLAYDSRGMDLTGRSNVTVKNMNITAFYYGIYLDYSSNTSLSGNTITDTHYNDIYLCHSDNNSISGNTIAHSWSGVEFIYSNNNSISANTFLDCGLSVSDSYENVVLDNLVNGKPLVYLENVSDRVVEDAGQVILVNCNRISVENSNLSRTTLGVELWQTNNTKISRNTITDTQSQGIYLYSSSNNSISENNMADNGSWGIYLEASPNNSINGNNITDTSYCGIELSSSWYNSIHGNNITNNGCGIWLGAGSNNSITENNITDNGVIGILLISSSTYNSISGNDIRDNGYYGISLQSEIRALDSTDNTVFHNDFINNTLEVEYWTSEHANFWDNGCEGNYWSNYNGTDVDNDGVGDTGLPWEGVDNYPLMNVYWSSCDINHDLEVNRTDIDISASAFGTRSGDDLWNPHADIKGPEPLVPDGKVDMRDISLVARHFGEHI